MLPPTISFLPAGLSSGIINRIVDKDLLERYRSFIYLYFSFFLSSDRTPKKENKCEFSHREKMSFHFLAGMKTLFLSRNFFANFFYSSYSCIIWQRSYTRRSCCNRVASVIFVTGTFFLRAPSDTEATPPAASAPLDTPAGNKLIPARP